MIVFKYFFRVLKSYKVLIIMYTAFLIIFGAFSLKTNNNSTNFVAEKPDVLIINNDKNSGITEELCNYIKDNSEIKEIKTDEESINDAIFYRDISYVIYIPEEYSQKFMNGDNPQIQVKSTGDYNSSFMEMTLEKFIKMANVYQEQGYTEEEIISNLQEVFKNNVEIEMTSKLDTKTFSNATFFYNFANYSILAGCVCVIVMVMSTFKDKNIKRRTLISSMKYTKYNRALFISNGVFAIILWAIYVAISFILIKDAMFTINGIGYIINSFIFTICCLSIAFLIGNISSNKNAINGIVNVIALGSSFLCGAFVPVEWLPDTVIKIAHILPSYWYIQNNELIGKLEQINIENLQPILINTGVIILFTIGFVILTNLISRITRKSN